MYNKSTLIGRLGADPEVRYTQDQKAIANLRVATTETWKDRTTGERKEKTEWHRVVLFGNLAEIARDYLKKGALALFEGPIRTRKWQDNNGQDQYTTEIHAETLKMLGQKSGESASNQASNHTPSAPAYGNMENYDDWDDDRPF